MKKILTFIFIQLLLAVPSFSQYVQVTVATDKQSLVAGESTTLHVYAQVIQSQRSNADRIFSWYVDFINETPTVARFDFSKLQRPASDKNPLTSSAGTNSAANWVGIHDTFINDSPTSKSGFGVNTPVELFSVPFQALVNGQARFSVRAGTGADGLAADFLVAQKGGGDPLIGGIYDTALHAVDIVQSAACTPTLLAAYTRIGVGQNKVTLTFTPCPGHTQFVEYSDKIFPATWLSLPNGPHNTGTAADTNSVKMRFYRVRVN